jgi:hypothetical protein
VGLFAAGSDDASGALAWAYLASGTTDPPSVGLTTATVALPMPTTPGTYDVRFFWNDAWLRLATSGPIMVGGPTVTLTSPSANATVGAGETVALAAYASDYGAGITHVDFAVNGNIVTSATAPPWTGAWGTAINGSYAITAVATDASGLVALSSTVTITVTGGSSGGGSGSGTPSCTVSLSPSSAAWPAAGGSSTVAVTTPAGCPWTAQSTAGWIHASSSGAGTGAVIYTVDANPSVTVTRSGSIVVGDATYAITQDVSCTFDVSQRPFLAISDPGVRVINVFAPPGCEWIAQSDVSWLVVSPGGSGDGVVAYSLEVNTTGITRTGHIIAADQLLTIENQGSSSALHVGWRCDEEPVVLKSDAEWSWEPACYPVFLEDPPPRQRQCADPSLNSLVQEYGDFDTGFAPVCQVFQQFGLGSRYFTWATLSGASPSSSTNQPDNTHGWAIVTDALRNGLDSIRDSYGPLRVTAAYRCPHRNSAVTNGDPKSRHSYHLVGVAGDMVPYGWLGGDMPRAMWDELAEAARAVGFTKIEDYNISKDHVHVSFR